jgi:WhiB family redox-sensing transcriptional regulator
MTEETPREPESVLGQPEHSEEPEIKLGVKSRSKACDRVREVLIRANKGGPLKGRAQIAAAIKDVLQQYFELAGNASMTTISHGAHEFEFREVLYALAVEDVTPPELATRLLEPTWSEDDGEKERKEGIHTLYTTINSRVRLLYDRKAPTIPISSRRVLEMAEIVNGGSLPEPLEEEDIKRLAGEIFEQVEARKRNHNGNNEHISAGGRMILKVGLYEAILRNPKAAFSVILSDELGIDLDKLDKETIEGIVSTLTVHIQKSHKIIFREEAAQHADKSLAKSRADGSATKAAEAAKSGIKELCGGAGISADPSALEKIRSKIFPLLPELARIRIMLCFPTAAPDGERAAPEERIESVMRERFALAINKIIGEPNSERRELLVRHFILGDPDTKGAIRPETRISNLGNLRGDMFAPDYLGAKEWIGGALCVGADPDIFFLESGGPAEDAKRVCGGCTVRAACLEYALANDERFGVWGGSTRDWRRGERRKRQAAAAKNPPSGGALIIRPRIVLSR